jgi:hypothetical protein
MRNTNLFINWFESTVRPEEFDYCLKQNLKVFDRVVNLNGRPTFTDFFHATSKFLEDVNVIANLDIYFDESIKLAQWITQDCVYCLTRWEHRSGGEIQPFEKRHYGHPGEWSQDAWICTGNKILDIKADFTMGVGGCDNHLAYLLKEAGFKILNPSKEIRAIHKHDIDPSASRGRGTAVGDRTTRIAVPITELKMT